MKLVFIVFNLLLLLGRVSCHPNGAPASVCDNMTPNHQAPGQTVASPFQVQVEKPFYKAGEPVTVKIISSGGNLIKGILVQAREVGKDAAIGTFSDNRLPSGVKYLKCGSNSKDAVTHSARLALSNISLQWSPPSDVSGMANISFLATVVKDKKTFWVKLASPELYKKDVQPEIKATTTMQMTVSSTIMNNNNTCKKGSKCNAHGFLPDLLLLFFSLVILLAEHVF